MRTQKKTTITYNVKREKTGTKMCPLNAEELAAPLCILLICFTQLMTHSISGSYEALVLFTAFYFFIPFRSVQDGMQRIVCM